jgi:diguanylate cyclase (GGDEF)-like protein
MLHSRHGEISLSAPRPENLVGLLRRAALAVLLLDLTVIALLLAPGAVPGSWRLPLRMLDAGLMLALALLLLLLLRRLARLLAERKEVEARQQMLFDAMPVALVVWTADDRLEHTNADFRRVYAPLHDLMAPGTPFKDLMRALVGRGLVPEALDGEEAWVDERLAQHRNPGPPMLRQMADGSWRRIVEQRLPDGRLLAYSVDITDMQEARADAERARQLLRGAVDALPATFELYDTDDRLVLHNEALRQTYPNITPHLELGLKFAELTRLNIDSGGQPDAVADPEAWIAMRQRQRRQSGPVAAIDLSAPDGRRLRLYERRLADGSMVAIRVDVTELERSRAAEAKATERLHEAIEALPAGFELYDADDRMVLVNSTLKRMYPAVADLLDQGLTFAELVRKNWERGSLVVPDGDIEGWIAKRVAQRGTGGSARVHELRSGLWVRTYERRTREGGLVGVRIDVTELMQRDRELAQVVAELDAANAELRRQADTDPLTGVANRRRFERKLASACQAGPTVALLLIDIDHFKRFNDYHGHPAGDACLRRVAAVLTASLRGPGDFAARIGGEEFTVLLPGEGSEGACSVAQRCTELLADAGIIHGDSPLGPHVTFSIGVAVGAVGTVAALLMERADAALYQAKREGRARWRLGVTP